MILARFRSKASEATFLRNFTFGVEDGVVSTVGLLSGIAFAGVPKATILLTGTILIFVEAFSMGIGSLLSEHSTEEFVEHRELPLKSSTFGALIMFFSYLVSGLIPLLPYFALPPGTALWVSIGISLVVLFLLGSLSAEALKRKLWRHGLEMLLLGGVAIIVGVLVGQVVHSL